MEILYIAVTLRAPWVHSLKEKRSEVKRILSGLRKTFSVSAAEAEFHDAHQTIGIAAAALVSNRAVGDGLLEKIVDHLEREYEPEVIGVQSEYR